MMTFGKCFKFKAQELDYDGMLIDSIYQVHAIGFTEAQEFLKNALGHKNFESIGEIQ